MCKGTLTIAHCAPEEPGKLAFSCSQLHMALLDTVICDKAQANPSPHLGGCGTIEKSFTYDPVDFSALRKHLCIRCSHKPVPIIPAQLSPEHHAPPVKQVWADESFMNMHFATAGLGPTSGLYSSRETSPHEDMDLGLSRITEESSLRDDETDDGDATAQLIAPTKKSAPATGPKIQERPTLVVMHKTGPGTSTTLQAPKPLTPTSDPETSAWKRNPDVRWISSLEAVDFSPKREYRPEYLATNYQVQEHVGSSPDDSMIAQASELTVSDSQAQEDVGGSDASIIAQASEFTASDNQVQENADGSDASITAQASERTVSDNQVQEHVGGGEDDSIAPQASNLTMTDNQAQEHVGDSDVSITAQGSEFPASDNQAQEHVGGDSGVSITTGAEEMVDDISPIAVIENKTEGASIDDAMPKQPTNKQPPQDMTETLKMPKVRDAARQLAMAKSFLLRSSA